MKRLARHPVFAFLLVAGAAGATWFGLITSPKDAGFPNLRAAESAEPATPAPKGLRVIVSGLPPVLYAGETRSIVVTVTNASGNKVQYEVVFATPWAESRTHSLAVQADSEGVAVFPVSIPRRPEGAAQCRVQVLREETPVYTESIVLFDGRGDLSDVSTNACGFRFPDGRRAILVNDYENETEYRRWAPVKWAVAAYERQGAKRILWTPQGLTGTVSGTTVVPYSGDPFASLRDVEKNIPAGGPAVLYLGWGFEEAYQRMPVENVVRLLDLTIDHARNLNPSIQIVLLTPPPLVGEEGIAARYAAALRNLAREHHAKVVDLHALMLTQEDWRQLYRLDGDLDVFGFWPSEKGRELIRSWIMNEATCEVSVIAGTSSAFIQSAPAESGTVSTVACVFPGIADFALPMEEIGDEPATAKFDVFLPVDAPFDLKPALYMKDKDGLWFQATPESPLRRAEWSRVELDLAPGSACVMPVDHESIWNRYLAARVEAMGIKFFSASEWSGDVRMTPVIFGRSQEKKPPPTIRHLRQATKSPKAYEPYELAFEVFPQAGNPFDPDDICVDAEFRSPSGQVFRRQCFYDQPCRRELGEDQVEVVTPSGRVAWRARFTPMEAGEHTWKLSVRTRGGSIETKAHSFAVASGKPHGFVRVSKSDPSYFETADGKWFYPLGENIHAPFDKRCAEMLRVPVLPNRGTFAYDDYFAKMAASGQNACVVWMSNWWVSIEWTGKWKSFHGLTDYNQENAWRLDRIFDAASRHGIQINLVLDNHGKLSTWVDSEWETNPYNVCNGGPCTRPEDFFVSPLAFDAYTKRLRYIIARWGHHPNLLGFELISELNLVGSDRKYKGHPDHAAWVKRAAAHLHKIDCYDRPITIQYSNDWQSVDEKVAGLPELDYIVGDAYKAGGSIVPLMIETAERNTRFGKPTFSAEFGGNWNGTTPQRLHADLHAGLWANAMTNTAGAPFFWWFDYIDRYGLYSEFRALASFMNGEDRRGIRSRTLTLPVLKDGKECRELGCVVLTASDRVDCWTYDTLASELMPEEKYARLHEEVAVEIPDLAPGRYAIEFWNTFTGEVVSREETTAKNNHLRLAIPGFRIDLAGKIRALGR